MHNYLAEFSDEELQQELQNRTKHKVKHDTEILYFSADLGVVCEVCTDRESWHDVGQEYYYVLNGCWYGTRNGDEFIMHVPGGDKVRTVTDWIETTRSDFSNIPAEYRNWI